MQCDIGFYPSSLYQWKVVSWFQLLFSFIYWHLKWWFCMNDNYQHFSYSVMMLSHWLLHTSHLCICMVTWWPWNTLIDHSPVCKSFIYSLFMQDLSTKWSILLHFSIYYSVPFLKADVGKVAICCCMRGGCISEAVDNMNPVDCSLCRDLSMG